MASEWRTYSLENCLSALIDYRGKTPVKTGSGVPLITAKIVKAGRIERPTEFISEADYPSWMRRGMPEVGDVVLTTEAPLGEVGRIRELPVGLAQRIVTLRGKAKLLHNGYLLYALQSEEMQGRLRDRSTGTTVLGIKQSELRKVEIELPPFSYQEEVAEILGCLDDRIDLLRQTNATLEAIAQALFKSWFVDFDPVRAKAEGREPEGMDASTAELFPSGFEESELGLIPRGWAIACLEEHVEAERGLSYKGAGLADPESGLPMHNLNSVLEGGGYKYAGIKFYKGDFKERHIAQAGDVVVANTEQGHHHRLIGFPAIVPRRFQRGLFSHHLYRVRIRDHSKITRHWIYHALMAPRVRDQIVGCANGSTVNMLKPAGLQIPRFVLPPGPLCERFEGLAVALHDRVETNVDLADSLAALRDTLLPRLISGKLLLPQAEAVEEASA